VWLRGGTYNAGIILNNKDGTVNNRITIVAYAAETPLIQNSTTSIFSGRYHGLFLTSPVT